MPAALAVIGSFVIPSAVVVIENKVLSFEPDNIGDPVKVFLVVGDNERRLVESDNHAGGKNITALSYSVPAYCAAPTAISGE